MTSLPKQYKSAIRFAQRQLGNLTDGSGTLIFDHAVRVYLILRQKLSNTEIPFRVKEAVLLAGLFHDLLEDTKTTEEEILKMGGPKTLALVKEMTIDFNGKTIVEAVSPLYKTSDELTLVKLADIYDNVRKSPYFLRNNGLKWYQTFFLPLLVQYQDWANYKLKRQKKYRLLVKHFS